MFALKVRDYNPAKGMFSVQQSYQKLKGKDVLGATKTEAGTRNVMLQDFLVREMDDYLLVHRDISFDDRIFADVNKQSMFRAIHRYAKIAGIPEIHVHCLRHSHVSMLKNMGFPLYEIGKRVGHNSIEITNHYAHVNEEVQKPMIEELNKLIEE